jgi:hypothetical protein
MHRGSGSAGESGTSRVSRQGCVEVLLSPRDPPFPLWDLKAAHPSHRLKSLEPALPIN